MIFQKAEKFVKIATLGVIVYLFCFALAQAIFPIRPFWNDEWRLIYNIKFKTISQLWGKLDLLQQCPRTFLSCYKIFTSTFDYSYASLRLPELVISLGSLFLLFYHKKKLFTEKKIFGYLFILIIISSQTFTDYLVQVKHYEMELLLCLVALWQLRVLLFIAEYGVQNNLQYFLLCASLLIAPFFSYTYPIAIAPVFPVVFLSSLSVIKNDFRETRTVKKMVSLYTPLLLVSCSIVVFYIIDVRQLMADNDMYNSYLKMLGNEQGKKHFLLDFLNFFALVGSGFLFEIIFGVLGVIAFFYTLYHLSKRVKKVFSTEDYFKLYAVFLLLITLALIFSGKILGGVARLTAFTVPSISLLITIFLRELFERHPLRKISLALTTIIFLGLFGNIISTCINTFTYEEYSRRIHTLWNTSEALQLAREKNLPILITDDVRGEIIDGSNRPAGPRPGKVRSNTIDKEQIEGAETLCAEAIIKVNPAYKVWQPIRVFTIPDTLWSKEYVQQLPAICTAAVVSDGLHYRIVTR